MSRAIEDAVAKAMGNQRRELHVATLSLLLGEMIRATDVYQVRALLLALAGDLEEFDRGPSPGTAS